MRTPTPKHPPTVLQVSTETPGPYFDFLSTPHSLCMLHWTRL